MIFFRISFRRWAQLICLFIFLVLLAAAARMKLPELFLAMDPALVGLTFLAARTFEWIFIAALFVLAVTPLFGRIFCGYICPMGTTIDLSDAKLARKSGSRAAHGVSPTLKIYLLAGFAGAALMGVGMVFWLAPLSLITRFYGMVVYPVVRLFSDRAVGLVRPAADWLDFRPLMFLEIEPHRFATQFFILGVFVMVFAAVRLSPRFWCRYVCPSGAMLSLLSKKPVFRRQVDEKCNQCGLCSRICPMGAIDPEGPETTRHGECIVCRQCEKKCPKQAISFARGQDACRRAPVSAERRRVLLAALAGAGTAAVGMTGLTAVADENAEGNVRAARLIRPPGALPEPGFLDRCVRCGECMSACPTNTLQPVWFTAGFLGMFSPAVTPRRKYCDPRCTVCGSVCPTGAINPLGALERVWARTGTAVIARQKCLAWEHKKGCMVCDEVCPYDAVEFEKRPELPYPVPHVNEDRCAGCGYCEHFCPVIHEAAIVVTPMNALRLDKGESYEAEGALRGYQLRLRPKETPGTGGEFETPGDVKNPEDGLPPGFDEGL